MSKGQSRADRLRRMEELYLVRAYSDIEMGLELGVDRSTAYKDRIALSKECPIRQNRDGQWHIDRTKYLSSIRVDLQEALVLYLAARRASQQMATARGPMKSALEKLAVVLRKPMTERLVRAADQVLARKHDKTREHIFALAAQAWAEGLSLRINYRGLEATRSYSDLLRIWLIEPSPWSDSIYLIGHSDTLQKTVSYKLDRIERASLSSEPANQPQDFNEQELLRHAWGIWHSEKEPKIVRLHFRTARAARRIRESVWHPLETVSDSEGEGCIWQAPIAELREMLPWIRGWGADVEVLEPAWLVEKMKKEIVRSGRNYKIEIGGPGSRPPHLWLYAKTNRNQPDEVHLLLYHLIDVGQTALAMWSEVLTDSIRSQLARSLDVGIDECGRFVALLASLHDLGKAGPAYQNKYGPDWLKDALNRAGLVLLDQSFSAKTQDAPHGTVSTWAMVALLPDVLQIDRRFLQKIATAIGGHHGTWPLPGATEHINDSAQAEWDRVRRDLVHELMGVFAPPTVVTAPSTVAEMNTFLTILSGLTSVADWVASRNDEQFGYLSEPMATRRYVDRSRTLAEASLEELGWLGWQPTGEENAFADVFRYLNFDQPRPVQAEVIQHALDLRPPTLLILEAPTGIGKTEIALYLADQWLQKERGRGLYVAMPTTATSNQMYERVGAFLHERYPDQPLNYHLVHGQAAWQDELRKQVALQGVGEDWEAHLSAESWFAPRKRTLLAPFGVGTVDQTLMSVLQTKHFFVRLFGLSHKVVIFDEVHAYDTYMNTLFHRLLAWLNAIGTSVILLSATLPAKTRCELVQAYSGQSLPGRESAYPALTVANADTCDTFGLSAPPSHTIALDWRVGREPSAIAEFLQQELATGGCAAVICNTVGRAQEVYRALLQARCEGKLDVESENLILFHGRFPPIWRSAIERQVLAKFGKQEEDKTQRPQRAIVVATQVIEQSLDIDFDLMVTDLAPVDLILQRAGRLHRHRDNPRHGLPRRLVITAPELDEEGLPQFVEDGFYGQYILIRSYFTLRPETRIEIPRDTTRLIESVYDPDSPLALPAEVNPQHLEQALSELQDKERETKAKAGKILVLEPGNRRLIAGANMGLEEEDPEVHETFRAQTRDIDFNITLVCLHKDAAGCFIYGEEGERVSVDLTQKPSRPMIKLLLQNAVSIQNRGVGKHFVDQAVPMGWRHTASLRYCRHILFENNQLDLPKHILRLTQKFGLEIIKKES